MRPPYKNGGVSGDGLDAALDGLEVSLAAGDRLEATVGLAYVVAERLDLEEEVLAAATRRALFVLAAGGDPHRDLTLDGPAVETLVRDLDTIDLRETLAAGLRALPVPRERPLVAAAVAGLLADEDSALRAFACALLAAELADEA
jgi:hypothetical protein